MNSPTTLIISPENSPGAWGKSLVQHTTNTMQAAHKHCKASWTRRIFHHFTHSHLCSRIFSLLLPVTIIFYLNVNYGDFQERGEGESVRITIYKELCFLELCQFWSQEAALAKKSWSIPDCFGIEEKWPSTAVKSFSIYLQVNKRQAPPQKITAWFYVADASPD